MGKVEFKVAVEPHQLQWLHDALRIYNLPDLGKTLRCLITYVQREENDADVFGKTRSKPHHGQPGKVEQAFNVESEQEVWLKEKATQHKLPDVGKVVRILLEYGMLVADPAEVFGVIRKMARSAAQGGGVGQISPFKLERWFAKYEFTAPYLLCCSDCEAMSMKELLAIGDAESLQRWESLSLGYTESAGLPALLTEIASTYDTTTAEDILVVVPEEGIFLTMLALLKPGDHVVATYPGYQSLFEVARSIGCHVDMWTPEPTDGGLHFNVDTLKELMKPSTRLVAVNFPHNPSGFIPSPAAWALIVDAVKAADDCFLFSDEMYRGLEFEESARLASGVDQYAKAITLCGMSKVYALPGLRIGWLATRNAALLNRIKELKDYTTICSSAPSEVLALMGLRAREQIIVRNMSCMRANLALLEAFFAKHNDKFRWSPPHGGTVCFPELITGESSDEWCQALVEQEGILLLPAAAYDYQPQDGRQHFRIGFARNNMPEVLNLLDTWLAKRTKG